MEMLEREGGKEGRDVRRGGGIGEEAAQPGCADARMTSVLSNNTLRTGYPPCVRCAPHESGRWQAAGAANARSQTR
eukprot:714123-Rhodomonas_salina.1